ncbi:MAG: hypothetical protein JNM83_00025 [Myxococcales bacterium]|nr:hypothetical protein [Myxococcales bacterium]
MKTVAGLADQQHGLGGHRLGRAGLGGQGRLLRFWVLTLALLPACDSLWRPYLEPCDATRPSCLDGSSLLPSNGIDPAWFDEAKVELAPTEDLVIDTDQGTVATAVGNRRLMGVSYHQLAAADCGGGWMVGVGVFGFTRVRIPEGVRVRFAGARAVALLSPGPIEIEGLLDVRGGMAECADPRCGGPGGFAGGFLQVPATRGDGPGAGAWGYGMGGTGEEAGGGGGGACGSGGKGGDAGTGYLGGSGGVAYQRPALIPLCGGSGGGAGGPGNAGGDPGQRGGGGGGAIQIVSQKSVSVGSTSATPSGIQAGGAGGQGDQGVNFNDGGGGGGSGGAILIEAPSIAVASGAVLAVNGGGGGGGYNGGTRCTSGEPGALSSTAAAGGTGICTGGAGGAGSMLHGGAAAGLVRDGGGGGGGGVGRIRLNSLDGTVTLGGELSPAMGECASTGRLNLR